MYVSVKYVILYTGVGGFAGLVSEGDKRVLLCGAILSAIFGSKFGDVYAVLSAIEFGVGFVLGTIYANNKKEHDE